MSEWVAARGLKLLGVKCIKHRENDDDVQIVGRYGVLYQTGENNYRAIIDNHKVYNNLIMELGLNPRFRAIKGEELLIDCNEEQALKILSVIKVPTRPYSQIKLSKRFSDPN